MPAGPPGSPALAGIPIRWVFPPALVSAAGRAPGVHAGSVVGGDLRDGVRLVEFTGEVGAQSVRGARQNVGPVGRPDGCGSALRGCDTCDWGSEGFSDGGNPHRTLARRRVIRPPQRARTGGVPLGRTGGFSNSEVTDATATGRVGACSFGDDPSVRVRPGQRVGKGPLVSRPAPPRNSATQHAAPAATRSRRDWGV